MDHIESPSLSGTPLSRREFLADSLKYSGGLIVAFHVSPFLGRAYAKDAAPLAIPNAFIRIAPDNSITIVINKLEMGQGVNTSLAQVIAEELECDWKSIQSISAPVDPIYNAVGMPMQMTGGSSSLRTSWDQHRKIGASMREMLKVAAARRWQVTPEQVTAENGSIVNQKTKEKLSYGALADAASKVDFPSDPPLKKAKDFKIIGHSQTRVDSPDKVNGKAIFGIDVRVPGMKFAAVARPIFPTAKLKSHDAHAAHAIRGVSDVIVFGNKVAVLASNTYLARRGVDALKVTWDYGKDAKLTSAAIMQGFKDDADHPGAEPKIADSRGDVPGQLASAKSVETFDYEFPYLAHAPMEPMNCTIHYDGEKADIWAGHQMPTLDRGAASKILGLPPEKVTVHTVYAGGSFGRRANKNCDYVAEACELAKHFKKPFKITWSREDDMRGGYYRPMYLHRIKIGLNEKKELQAWEHQIVGQSIMQGSPMAAMMKDGIDPTVVEGIAHTAYQLPHFRCRQQLTETPITTLWWRSVGNTHTAYVMETMIDELAEKAGKDPFDYRRALLKDSPKHLAVLDLLEKRVGDKVRKTGGDRAWGLAIHESFQSVVGAVAEVSVENGFPRTHKIWAAVHCGQVVNPEVAKTQVEGAAAFALSSLFQEIELNEGKFVQGNFDNFPVLRIQDMPEVSVELVETDAPPTGLGEPGVPPIAPAVANAVYRLTKKRARVLPFNPARV